MDKLLRTPAVRTIPELRKDPILDDWVIVAETRSGRPNEFAGRPSDPPPPTCQQRTPPGAAVPEARAACPFCLGHEGQTPRELLTLPSGTGGRNWQVRVVPNKYPALVPEADRHAVPPDAGSGLGTAIAGAGAHEVVVESPRHLRRTSQLSDAELALVLRAVRQRLRHWKKHDRWKYGIWFKNVGEAAGASMVHLHSQLIGLPIVPGRIVRQIAAAEAWYRRHGQCIYCRLAADAVEAGDRLVDRNDGFVTFCPAASRFAYETWILPAGHAPRFEDIESPQLDLLARTLRRLLQRVERVVQTGAYNVVLHTAPFDIGALPHYHWHMEVLPQTSRPAGFEWATGMAVNPVPPDKAALLLRRSAEGREPKAE